MPDEVPDAEVVRPPAPAVVYSPTQAAISQLKDQCKDLLADPAAAVKTAEGYEQVRSALAVTRNWRGQIEKQRQALKADSIEYGRRVDAEAKKWVGLVLAIEDPLKAAKEKVDEEKEKARLAAVEAERLKAEAEEKAKRDAEEARLKAIRDAEEAKLRAERESLEAERRRLAEEKAADDARRKADEDRRKAEEEERQRVAKAEADRVAAEQKAERDRIAAEQSQLAAERDRIEQEKRDLEAKAKAEQEAKDRAEFERKAREQAEKDARQKAEREALERRQQEDRDRLAAEEAAREKARVEKAEADRLAAARPDVEKIRRFGEELRFFTADHVPELRTPSATTFFETQRAAIEAAWTACEAYTAERKRKAAVT